MKTVRVGNINQYKDYNGKTIQECIDKIRKEYIDEELNNINKLKLDFVFEKPDAITRLAIAESFAIIQDLEAANTVNTLSTVISNNSIDDGTEVVELKIKQSKTQSKRSNINYE